MNKVIGLTGRPASGKSVFARCAEEHGAFVIDVDNVGHEVLKHPETIVRLSETFGAGILDQDGGIDRRKLGGIVFANASALKHLETIVHPRMCKSVFTTADAAAKTSIVLIDAAILAHMELADRCDHIVVIEAPWVMRVGFAQNKGWNEEELKRRDKSYPADPFPGNIPITTIINDQTEYELETKAINFIEGMKHGTTR